MMMSLRLKIKIARLELDINGYAIQFNKAIAEGNNEDKMLFAGLIKIARFELDINGYAIKLEKAEADGDGVREERYAGLIKSARSNLDTLLSQEERTQHSSQQGN
jgi:hypothetical protein